MLHHDTSLILKAMVDKILPRRFDLICQESCTVARTLSFVAVVFHTVKAVSISFDYTEQSLRSSDTETTRLAFPLSPQCSELKTAIPFTNGIFTDLKPT